MIPFNKPEISLFDIYFSLSSLIVDYRKKIENWFASYTRKDFNYFTDSCKSALYFFYKSLDIKGKVAISPLTCITSILPLISAGYKPHYIDIDINSLNMDPESLDKALEENDDIKILQIIHLGGNPSKISELVSIAKERNILIIEDCAQSLGAEYQGKNTGSWGDAACFSFRKNISSTGGGLISLNNEQLALKIKKQISQFAETKYLLRYYRLINLICDKYSNNYLGSGIKNFIQNIRDKKININTDRDTQWLVEKIFCASSWDASLAISQLEKLPVFIKKRRFYGELYNSIFKNKQKLFYQKEDMPDTNIYTKYFLGLNISANGLLNKLLSESVNARHLEDTHIDIFQKRIDQNEIIFDKSIFKCKNYFKVHDNIITLPIFPGIREEQVHFIGNLVLQNI